MNGALPPGLGYYIYGPPQGYYDPDWEEKVRLSGLKSEIQILEAVAGKAQKPHTLDILFNRLAACYAAVAAIILSRP